MKFKRIISICTTMQLLIIIFNVNKLVYYHTYSNISASDSKIHLKNSFKVKLVLASI